MSAGLHPRPGQDLPRRPQLSLGSPLGVRGGKRLRESLREIRIQSGFFVQRIFFSGIRIDFVDDGLFASVYKSGVETHATGFAFAFRPVVFRESLHEVGFVDFTIAFGQCIQDL